MTKADVDLLVCFYLLELFGVAIGWWLRSKVKP